MTDSHFEELQKYERELAAKGIRIIGGIDEAGRGPLAGPVCAGCVILPSEGPFPRADDSKKLSGKKRDELYDGIVSAVLSYGVGMADNNEIDELNILNATKLAMKRACEDALKKLREAGNEKNVPEIFLIDHVRINDFPYEQLPITHGDALSVTIGAASIIAKVTRDRLMTEYDSIYPEYGFAKHKGYGTKAHYEAIREFGPSPIHRKTFLKEGSGWH